MANYFVSKDFKKISVDQISRNPNQPRKVFDEEALSELARSIKTFGVITPLTVRKSERGYELIAGERRLRAAKLAGLSAVPCYIANADEEESSFMAVVENLQRRDLDFFEEAVSLRCLVEKYGFTQAQVAEKIGKTQSAVANKIRLLKLSSDAMETVRTSGLSERHARALLKVPDEKQNDAAREMVRQKMTVDQSEKYIEKLLSDKKAKVRKDFIFIKDVRIFLNTLARAAETMRRSGVDVKIKREEDAAGTVVTVTIPQSGKSLAQKNRRGGETVPAGADN